MKKIIKSSQIEHVKFRDYRNKNIQVVDYVKDNITGVIHKLKKIKPVGASVNTCLIELFDAITGQKTVEALSHNIVNDFQNRQAFMAFFYDQIRTANASEISLKNPFQNLLLSDYAGNENAAELGFRGNVIGWANKTTPYAGGDILKGTINVTESAMTDAKKTGVVKAVFDFPTSAANGSINSVWWCYGSSSGYKYLGYPSYSYASNGGGNDMACDGNYIYFVSGSSGTITRLNMDGSTGVSSVDFSGTDTKLVAIDFDGTFFWLYGSDTKRVYKCNTSFQVASQFTASEVTGTVLSITIHNGKIFICTSSTVYVYDASTQTLVTTKSATSYGFSSTGIARAKANASYFAIQGTNGSTSYWGYLDGNGDLLHKQDISEDAGTYGYFRMFCFTRSADYNNSRLLIMYGYNAIVHLMIGGVGAHTKLATTVQKTSANAMKVTYTFDIDIQTALTW